MKNNEQRLSLESARARLRYDPETGAMHWACGKEAGTTTPAGYRQVWIEGHPYMGHRLAFFIQTGNWPKAGLDHRNGRTADNRWENLREASHGENMRNQKTPKNNKSGIKGVSWYPRTRKWSAQICKDGKNVRLGYYDSKDAAALAYAEASAKLHGSFSRLA